MISLLAIVALGFLLGMRHATDPDHVIAVSTIVTREHDVKRSAWIGAAWGLGHTLTILIVGGAIILFRITLPPRVGLAMELAVAIMLILLGIRNLRGVFTSTAKHDGAAADAAVAEESARYHAHGDYVHVHHHPQVHAHPHDPRQNPVSALDARLASSSSYQLLRPLIIGVVHGLAGSAAIALLVLGTIRNLGWALVYLGVFGFGTILGMMLITLTVGSTFVYGRRRFAWIERRMGVAAGLISLAFGLFIAYQIGFVDGLFTSQAHWVPR